MVVGWLGESRGTHRLPALPRAGQPRDLNWHEPVRGTLTQPHCTLDQGPPLRTETGGPKGDSCLGKKPTTRTNEMGSEELEVARGARPDLKLLLASWLILLPLQPVIVLQN